MNLEDASYRELVEYRIDLIDLIYSNYYYGEMSKDNNNELSEEFKNYLKEYDDVTYEIYSRNKELEEYVRIAKNDKSPYYFYTGYYKEMEEEIRQRYKSDNE